MPLYKILVTKPYLTSLNITPSGSTSNHPNIYPIGSIIEFKYTFSRVVYIYRESGNTNKHRNNK